MDDVSINASTNPRSPDLSWLADAPAFIDGQQVSAFYDAVVGPAFKAVELQVSTSQTEQLERSAGGHLNTSLSALFPWWRFDVGGDIHSTRATGEQQDQSVSLQPIESPARQLVQLSVHYLVNQPDRICMVGQDTPLPEQQAIAESPRMIAFVDIQPGAKFMPLAAELNDGKVVTFYETLMNALNPCGAPPPAYPESRTTEAGKHQRDAYWRWFVEHWNMDKAVKVVEEGIGAGGRPRWIAYRMVFNNGKTLHLDVTPHGGYDTGVFAYNFIRRGERYGLRIVGSLKSQPAMNVLAIYEK